ncbi:nuclear transport factor 2 family protein [Haliangium sp.]|uniref:nuclear transport factor 2 family protein n=1 Tax=Haliangium sp. TaxID=2663208 RepID=UPI003D0D4D45
MSHLEIAKRYIEILNDPDSTPADLEPLLAPDLQQTALPNALSPRGGTRDRAAVLEGFVRGKELIERQHFEILREFTDGDEVVLEVSWEGRLRRAVGSLQVGTTLRADVAIFLEFADSRIRRQRNYDCYHQVG